ncbi:hypothetical protein [Synechococcus sp. CBW1107]|uniref:hypothetical protein n=1 Tax=Synechococcus sp. CBW1107 TaxID=2789857 RepID=UPI002AD500CE|nr:hypothetical protein [Synechococcus sp. CBW1107]
MYAILAQRLRSKIRSLLPGSVVSLIQDQTGAPHMLHSLLLLKQKGFRPQTANDIGAFKGQWSRDMRRVFPDVNLLMVEPLPDMQPGLELLTKEIGAETACQLLSDQSGEQVVFYVGSCGSSMHRPKRFQTPLR